LKPFKHINAITVKEALRALSDFKGDGRIIAGGTDLIDELERQVHPEYLKVLINIKTIPNLKFIEENTKYLKIGVLTTLREIEANALTRERYPVLFEAAQAVGTPQIRNMATLGGNLCQHVRCWYYRASKNYFHCYRKGGRVCFAIKGDNRYNAILGGKGCFAAFPSDLAVALVALNAKVKIASSEGEKTTTLENFYATNGTILKPNELITEIYVPRAHSSAMGKYLKFSLRKMDFAIASAAAMIETEDEHCNDIKIVLGGVAPIPWRAIETEKMLKGKKITEKLVKNASQVSTHGALPLTLNAYKISITQSLVKRAIIEALQSNTDNNMR
jgi:xanthine dehydrogenase YagS FAD-binding subunit